MIRCAKQEDILQIYPLIYIIWEDMAHPLLELLDNHTFKKVMLHLMSLEDSKFSYKNAIVYEKDNHIIGILYGYPGKQERQFDEQLLLFMQTNFPHINHDKLHMARESHDGEWYLDSLVVHPDYRGKGVGKALFHYLHQQPLSLPIGLNCEVDNELAYALYSQLGYQTAYQTTFLGHHYYHMQK